MCTSWPPVWWPGGWWVDVLTAEHDRGLPPVSEEGGVTVRRFLIPVTTPRYRWSPSLFRYLRRTRNDYDVVHAHNYHELVPLMAALARPSRLVLTPHYHPPNDSRLDHALRVPHRVLMRRVARSVEAVICVTGAEAAALMTESPDLGSRALVIPNGVDTQRLSRADAVRTGSPFVVSVGRLEEYKRVDLVIRACAALPAGYELVVIGDGPARAGLESLAQQSRVSVRFLGRITDDELHGWVRGASLLVTMSEREAFGLVILEAFSAGVPVVCSDLPAHRETAGYGPAGAATLVPVGSPPEALARAITAVLAAPPVDDLGANVPTWSAMCDRTLGVYRSLDPAGRWSAHRDGA